MNTKGWSRREVLTGAVGAAASVAILGATGASCTAAFAKTTQQEPADSSTASGEQARSSLGTTPARNAKLYKPGDTVPTSGAYEAIHDKLDGNDHAQPHPVIAVSGKRFPPCRVCMGQARFRLLLAADFVDADNHFKS
jgi:hypothetical protein